MKKENKIPEFYSLKEMAEFWDNNEFTNYANEFEATAELKFDIKNRYYLPITLDMYEKMENIALEKGVSVEKLMRAWVEEKLANSIEV